MEALTMECVSFSYAGSGRLALEGVSMSVPAGSFALLCGGVGGGKTTLLRCVKREIAPAGRLSGTIRVFGEDVTSLSSTPQAGFVFQDPEAQVVCDTVWRELAFGLENAGVSQQQMRRRVAEVASLFGMSEWFDAKTADLSGGQLQILNLASVIAMQPTLLLLDEPASQLDPVSASRFIDVLAHLNRDFGMTVLVATHSPELFQACATCAFEIAGGKVLPADAGLGMHPSRTCRAGAFGGVGDAATEAPCRVVGDAVQGADSGGAPENTGGALAISLSGAWFAYGRDGRWVLRDMSLDVWKGETVALVGANGCGKTTILKIVAGTKSLNRGRLERPLAGSQAYLPQNPRLLFACDTVEEELADWSVGAGYGDAEVEKALDRFGLAGHRRSNPLDLSGGQQSMLALAKLLLCRPRLLLLDEPVKGLDAPFQMEVAQALEHASRLGTTVVMATHSLSFACRVADRMALVFDGQVASVGTPAEFCEGNMFYTPRRDGFAILFDRRAADGRDSGENAE